jgi:hypothetical protein
MVMRSSLSLSSALSALHCCTRVPFLSALCSLLKLKTAFCKRNRTEEGRKREERRGERERIS